MQLKVTRNGEVIPPVTRPLLVRGGEKEALLDLGLYFWRDCLTFTGHVKQYLEVRPWEVQTLAWARAITA